jgi:hypothetical protein
MLVGAFLSASGEALGLVHQRDEFVDEELHRETAQPEVTAVQVADNEPDSAHESADLGGEANGVEPQSRWWAELDSEVVEDDHMVTMQRAPITGRLGEDEIDAQPLTRDRRDDPRAHPPKVH